MIRVDVTEHNTRPAKRGRTSATISKPALYSRVAGSTLVVTSCFANTLFITLLTPSTPCTRVRSAFQSARIKALNTVRRAQTGAAGWPLSTSSPRPHVFPRLYLAWPSSLTNNFSFSPSLLLSLLLSKSQTIGRISNLARIGTNVTRGVAKSHHPTTPSLSSVSRIRSCLRCFLTESCESVRSISPSRERETFIRQSYLSLVDGDRPRIKLLQPFFSRMMAFFSYIGEVDESRRTSYCRLIIVSRKYLFITKRYRMTG